MDVEGYNIYEFGPFRLIPHEHYLLCGEEVISLQPKAFELLVVLVQNSGHLVTKDELMRSVWPDTIIEENNLNVNISLLRKALQSKDSSAQEEYIKTVHRRGYRFIAEVKTVQGKRTDLVPIEGSIKELAAESSEQPLMGELIDRSLDEIRNEPDPKRRMTIDRPRVIIIVFGLILLSGLLIYGLLRGSQKTPRINSVAVLVPPSPRQQFIVRIDGDGFNHDVVQVIVTGPGCKKFGACIIPNDVLQNFGNVTITQIENVPITVDAGEYQIFVQNGPEGPISNAWVLTVPEKSVLRSSRAISPQVPVQISKRGRATFTVGTPLCS